RSDSSALAVLGAASPLTLLALDEMRPRKGAPLKPSAVVASFAAIARDYGVDRVSADAHYVESIREHLDSHALHLRAAPEGQAGKARTYLHLRSLVHERKLRLPKHARLLAQLKAVVAKPAPGGGLLISSPRRAG